MQSHADVLLIYAEAQAMSAGVDASAYNAINRVRERAGLEDIDPGLSSTEFQKKVIEERGWELGTFKTAIREVGFCISCQQENALFSKKSNI